MEICNHAQLEPAQDHGYHYRCDIYGFKMGLDLNHWCKDCPHYDVIDYETEYDADNTRLNQHHQLPCSVCRYRHTCTLTNRHQSSCPSFTQG